MSVALKSISNVLHLQSAGSQNSFQELFVGKVEEKKRRRAEQYFRALKPHQAGGNTEIWEVQEVGRPSGGL